MDERRERRRDGRPWDSGSTVQPLPNSLISASLGTGRGFVRLFRAGAPDRILSGIPSVAGELEALSPITALVVRLGAVALACIAV
jgi:hypothetical protein